LPTTAVAVAAAGGRGLTAVTGAKKSAQRCCPTNTESSSQKHLGVAEAATPGSEGKLLYKRRVITNNYYYYHYNKMNIPYLVVYL